MATETDLRDYFRLPALEARDPNCRIGGGRRIGPGYRRELESLSPSRRKNSAPNRRAGLISPFDPLIWERKRPERLFGFHYRIGIYTPAHKREDGYYVLPFLLGDQLVARVDLKAERKERKLQVLLAVTEAGAKPDR